MIDELLPRIERAQAAGAVVLLKWDGEREHRRCTIVISRKDTDYVWRSDTGDLAQALAVALAEYEAGHG